MPIADYILTIGLEVHCQLKTESKMFCACPTSFGDTPNTNVCPVCLGLPGALPVLNQGAIERTIAAGLMLGCKIPEVVKWDRKNYFYPDMPKNYQITQFDLPLCVGGGVPLADLHYPKDAQKSIANPGKIVKMTRIHLEEDVAKSTHQASGSVIDYNRAGTPLMEIVSDPDLDSAEETVAYLNSLRQILVYGGMSDADMEKGQMRCDVNISLRPKGTEELGAKVELKNLNSISAVRRAIYFEMDRQASELDQGIAQIQSTRRWDDERGETSIMRTKEDAHDYRYFPDPDLLPVTTPHLVAAIAPGLPELPSAKSQRFIAAYELTPYDAGILTSERPLADYFETAAKGAAKPKLVANWVINELLGQLNAAGLPLAESPVQPAQLRELVGMIEAGKVSNGQAKEIFGEMFANGGEPAAIAKARGFEQVSDDSFIEALVDQVMAEDPGTVADIRGGNAKAINSLRGKIMKLSAGKANPKVVGEVLERKLNA
jgi:aspartyl-tRNA(Asn)/glutamyl-tRNA(Gln) amidotransferase subunit B